MHVMDTPRNIALKYLGDVLSSHEDMTIRHSVHTKLEPTRSRLVHFIECVLNLKNDLAAHVSGINANLNLFIVFQWKHL